MNDLWINLLANLGIVALFVSVWAYSLEWVSRWPRRLQAVALAGMAGGAAIVLMQIPFQIRPGIIYDLRVVPIAIAGFFGGPIVGIAAGAATAIYRAWLGGAGAGPGIIAIGVALLIALAGHFLLRDRLPRVRDVVLLAAAIAVGPLVSFFTFPGLWRTLLPEIAIPGMSLVFTAMVMVGLAVLGELRRRDIARANQVYRAVIDALPEPLNAKDPEGRFVAANPATAELMQAENAEALIGKTDFDFYPPDIAAAFRRDEEATIASGHPSIIEQHVLRRDGSSFWLSTLKVPLLSPTGNLIGILTHNRDISDRKRLEDERALAERRLADALANMADGLVMFDAEDRLVLCNARYREMFSKTAALRVPGARFRDILRASIETGEQAGVAPGEVEAWIEKTCASLHVAGETYIQLGDGRWFHTRVRPTADGGSLSVISDVTATRLAEQKLSELNDRLAALARLDGLTGLTNRRAFDESLATEFRRSARTGAPISLLMIDVDNFKAFNDTYGHPAGDNCLKAIAQALTASTRRPADIAARYGGEELATILPETDAQGAMAVAEGIRLAIRKLAIPHAASPPGIVTVSIGVATRAGRGPDRLEELVARADEALYTAKAAGRDRVVASDPRLVDLTAGTPRSSAARLAGRH